MNYKSLISPISFLVFVFGIGMLVCAATDWAFSGNAWPMFTLIGMIIVIIGGTFSIFVDNQPVKNSIGSQEGYFLIVVVWIIFPTISALPFIGLGFSFTDSIFESVSGLTTTGATIVTGLDNAPIGLLLWRAILQWIGGLAIIVTAVIVLPSLGVGGMEVFHYDSTESSGKFAKNFEQLARRLIGIYLALSMLCMLLYWVNGMSVFDSIAHAMTTVSAGGFSTSDSSFLNQNQSILMIAIIFMVLVGLPFMVFEPLCRQIFELVDNLKKRITLVFGPLWNRLNNKKHIGDFGKPSKLQWKILAKDSYKELSKSQIRVYLLIIIASTVIVATFGIFPEFLNADIQHRVTHTAFNVASILTGTGYASADYNSWGAGAMSIFIVLMFCGGCAGSASCGMRIFRLQIAASTVNSYCKKMVSPHRVSDIVYDGKRLEKNSQQAVMVFLFLYITTFLVSATLLALNGLDSVTAISAAAASVSNVGPGFGEIIGPTGTFQPLSDIEKWICLVTMLFGRLEFLAFFVVLTPRFWLA